MPKVEADCGCSYNQQNRGGTLIKGCRDHVGNPNAIQNALMGEQVKRIMQGAKRIKDAIKRQKEEAATMETKDHRQKVQLGGSGFVAEGTELEQIRKDYTPTPPWPGFVLTEAHFNLSRPENGFAQFSYQVTWTKDEA